MMTNTYSFPLFALLIACRLYCYEAVYSPPIFKPLCLLIVEEDLLSGLWRYDPDAEVIKGIPTMYKFKRHIFSTTDISKVYEDTNIDRSASLSWSKTWWWFSSYALRFSKNKSRLKDGVSHPCKFDTGGQSLWEVLKDHWGLTQVGWAQVINEIVNVECVPQHGSLSSQSKYDLPEYDGYKTVYLCATWLRRIEASSDVDSKATAVEVDSETEICTLYYEDHGKLGATSGNKEYCFLRKTFDIPRFPGFYMGCQIYVEDPVFAGLWELDITFKHNWIPYLRRRRATMDDPLSTKVTLHGGYDSADAVFVNGQLEFRLNQRVGLEIPMRWHICIGPDTGQTESFETSDSQFGTIYRDDEGLDCVPFYGFSELLDPNFLGFQKYTLTNYYSLRGCKDYIEAEYPFGHWKVIISSVDDGLCWAFGGGLDYTQIRLVSRPNTYSCFSTKHHKTIHPSPSCKYCVEAGLYSGIYAVKWKWLSVYSLYPTLINISSASIMRVVWKDGYQISATTDAYSVVYSADLGDENICAEKEDPKVVPVMYKRKQVGVIYRFDANMVYIPWPIFVEPRDRDYTGFYEFSDVESLKDCMDKYKEKYSNDNWSAVVRNDSECTVYDNDLSFEDMRLTWMISHLLNNPKFSYIRGFNERRS